MPSVTVIVKPSLTLQRTKVLRNANYFVNVSKEAGDISGDDHTVVQHKHVRHMRSSEDSLVERLAGWAFKPI